jgi:hypothetical protein
MLARKAGFETRTKFTDTCTRNALAAAFEQAAAILRSGDVFLWTISCHGGQIPDVGVDENDGLDETLCLFDGQWLDDETKAKVAGFAPGVRVVIVVDACHSGSSLRSRQRGMPATVAVSAYLANKAFYDSLPVRQSRGLSRIGANASTVALCACKDDQVASDGEVNGLFTAKLLQVWNAGHFVGNYESLHTSIRNKMPSSQTPTIQIQGPLSQELRTQYPFSIEGVNDMSKKPSNSRAAWSDDAGDGSGGNGWGRAGVGTVIRADTSVPDLKTLTDGSYVASRTAPSSLYLVRNGALELVSPPDAVASGVSQADIAMVDPLLLAAHPTISTRSREQTFHLWSDLRAGHSMESWGWFSPGKVSVRTVTRTVTWFGGYTGGVTAVLVGPDGTLIPEADLRATYGVDGTAFGSGERDETYEWDIPQSVLDRADSITFVHYWAPKVDIVMEVVHLVEFLWDLYCRFEGQDDVSVGSEVLSEQ